MRVSVASIIGDFGAWFQFRGQLCRFVRLSGVFALREGTSLCLMARTEEAKSAGSLGAMQVFVAVGGNGGVNGVGIVLSELTVAGDVGGPTFTDVGQKLFAVQVELHSMGVLERHLTVAGDVAAGAIAESFTLARGELIDDPGKGMYVGLIEGAIDLDISGRELTDRGRGISSNQIQQRYEVAGVDLSIAVDVAALSVADGVALIDNQSEVALLDN